MTLETFSDMVRKIRNSFGLTHYRHKATEEHSEVVIYLWEVVGSKIPGLAEDEYMQIFRNQNSKYPSTVQDAYENSLDEWWRRHPEKRAAERGFDPGERGHCNKNGCRDGLIFTRCDGLGFAWRCPCDFDWSKRIPIWNGESGHEVEMDIYGVVASTDQLKRGVDMMTRNMEWI